MTLGSRSTALAISAAFCRRNEPSPEKWLSSSTSISSVVRIRVSGQGRLEPAQGIGPLVPWVRRRDPKYGVREDRPHGALSDPP